MYTNSYTYDAAGNQITRVQNGVTQTRTFDAENRLVRIVAGSTTSEFVYDANRQRVMKSVSSAGTTTRSAYIGSLHEETLNGSATPPYIVYYLFGARWWACAGPTS